MAQRPLPEMLSLTARVPRGEAGYWTIIRSLDKAYGHFTVPDVEGETNVKPGGVAQYVRKLVAAGIASHWSNKPAPVRACKVYRLLKRPSEAPRLRTDGTSLGAPQNQYMWRAMRTPRGKVFTARDIAFEATVDEMINEATAARYIAHLARAGILVARGHNAFSLKPSMDSGPLAPAILRVDVVFDRNLQRAIGEAHDAVEVSP